MTKYVVFAYWGNDAISTGIIICTDTSKSSLCKKLGFDDPYKIGVDVTNEGVIYIDYDGKPCYALHAID